MIVLTRTEAKKKIAEYIENHKPIKTGEKLPNVSNEEKLKIIKEHIELAMQEKEEITAIREMRKHIAWYTKNLKNSSEFRNSINKIESKSELIKQIDEYFETL